MPRTAKTPEQRLAELEKQQEQIKARIQREKAKLRTTERKRDTRRKIIAGALALEHAGHDPAFGEQLQRILHRYVERPEDRALFDLEPRDDSTSTDNQNGTTPVFAASVAHAS